MIRVTLSPYVVTLNTIEDYMDSSMADNGRRYTDKDPITGAASVPVSRVISPLMGPPMPVPDKYRDGRLHWTNTDGAVWRYNERSCQWIQTSEGS